ncbi:MAG TPA: zinc ribbon domain-containing protein [Candidatus Omnitrophota bacterium]|nr:zinc ribbon domain-containing protein [Candidatus Omnitrophota bacterium]HPS36122.1 zinc ribbon domain-containing protein [Candidatus Omnitrophota bacterium]
MPTYEYECGACGHRFEKFQSMTEKPLKQCPECGKNKIQRIIHGGAGVLFKGSGFYQTDYRSKGYKESARKDKVPSPAAPCSGDCSSCPSAKK